MKKIWGYILAAFSILSGLFLLERSKRKNAEAELTNANYKKEDAVLKERQTQSEISIAQQQNKIKELKESHAKETQGDMTISEAEAYWNKRQSPK